MGGYIAVWPMAAQRQESNQVRPQQRQNPSSLHHWSLHPVQAHQACLHHMYSEASDLDHRAPLLPGVGDIRRKTMMSATYRTTCSLACHPALHQQGHMGSDSRQKKDVHPQHQPANLQEWNQPWAFTAKVVVQMPRMTIQASRRTRDLLQAAALHLLTSLVWLPMTL